MGFKDQGLLLRHALPLFHDRLHRRLFAMTGQVDAQGKTEQRDKQDKQPYGQLVDSHEIRSFDFLDAEYIGPFGVNWVAPFPSIASSIEWVVRRPLCTALFVKHILLFSPILLPTRPDVRIFLLNRSPHWRQGTNSSSRYRREMQQVWIVNASGGNGILEQVQVRSAPDLALCGQWGHNVGRNPGNAMMPSRSSG